MEEVSCAAYRNTLLLEQYLFSKKIDEKKS